MKRLMAVMILMALACLAWAGDGPLPEVDPKEAANALINGISHGGWILICSGGGLLVIWLLRLLLIPKLTGKPLAITSCVLIGIATVGTTLITSPTDWLNAIMLGVAAGLAAGKAWDLIPEAMTDAAEKPIKKRANGATGKIGANDDVIGQAMNWQTVLTLVLAGCMLVGFIWLGVALHLANKRTQEARAKAAALKGKWREAVDEIVRMIQSKKNRELTNEEARKKLQDGIDSWNPNDPSDSGAIDSE